MKKKTEGPYIVVYDDGDCITLPMTLDKECEGALNVASDVESIALFPSRDLARKSIAISKHHNMVLKLQGKVRNEDFDPENIKNVKIRKCRNVNLNLP
jgi:hypothetical protein